MRKLKFVLDRKSLQAIYFSFITPLLEYADVMWDNCTQYEVDEIKNNPDWGCAHCNRGNKACIPKSSILWNRIGHINL